MLKYLKTIVHLVKNLGGYLTYHPLQSKNCGNTPENGGTPTEWWHPHRSFIFLFHLFIYLKSCTQTQNFIHSRRCK